MVTLGKRRSEEDGRDWIYVVDESTGYFEPQIIRSWFPIGRYSSWMEDRIGCQLRRDSLGFYWEVREDGLAGLKFALINGGETRAEHTDLEPLPCPKVRKGTEVKYEGGMWKKYLRSQGWVAA